ncbi:hypothetical protein LJC42_05860 [Eubacteriales bacterium OttesenSCG-928-K08]|nr:hypothetical protein [Eubacteriales bacterium OttesenSCG-928-K08]
MKRANISIALLLALITCTMLAGCSSPDATTPETEPSSTPTILPTPTPQDKPAMAQVTPVPAPTPTTYPADGYIAREGVNLRAAPKDGAIVEILGENYPVTVIGLTDGWYHINYEGDVLYASQDLIELGEPPRVHNMRWGKVVIESAQLYKSPDKTDLSEVSLVQDDVVRILREVNGYLHIVYNRNLQRYLEKSAVAYISQDEADLLLPAPTPKPLSDQLGA